MTGQKFKQSTQSDKSLQAQAIDAIAEYIEQQSIETAIIENLPAFSQQLNQLTIQFDQSEQLHESKQAQAIDALAKLNEVIAQYIQQENIEATIVEKLPAFSQQLNQLKHKRNQTVRLDETLQTQAIEVIAKYIEQQSIETAIIENLPALTSKLNQLNKQPTQTEQLDESLQKQAVDVIAKYVEQQSIESVLVQTGQSLSQAWQQLLPNRSNRLIEQPDKQLDNFLQQVEPASKQQEQGLEKIEILNRLTDRDFFELYQKVAKHFKAALPSPPPVTDRQLVKNEVQQLVNQINDLRQNQVKQLTIVESMQKNRFRAWDKKYNYALLKLEKTTKLINQLTTQKTQKHNQIKEWSKQDEIYQAWKHSPYTIQMQTLIEVFAQPQMQKRLSQIQQEIDKMNKIKVNNYNKHQKIQNDKEISL